jgi:hypothetical protein
MHKLVNGVEVALTQSEIDDFNARAAAHETARAAYALVAYKDERLRKYIERGVTIEAMSVAVWEKVMENRPEEADRLQTIREQIKLEEPKP